MTVSFRFHRRARNLPVAVVDPPYELLGEFLTVESPSWICKELPEVLMEIKTGEQTEYEHGGNAHSILVSKDRVVIETTCGPKPRICEASFEGFVEVVDKWCEYVRNEQRKE